MLDFIGWRNERKCWLSARREEAESGRKLARWTMQTDLGASKWWSVWRIVRRAKLAAPSRTRERKKGKKDHFLIIIIVVVVVYTQYHRIGEKLFGDIHFEFK